MKYIMNIFLLLALVFFAGCSSKNKVKINSEIKSISLNKDVVVAGVPRSVKSPVSIGLGLGGYVSKHVGIHMGTSVRPDVKNTDALNLQKGIAKFNLSLSSLVRDEFTKQMKNDKFYKNRFVPFGSDHTIHLFVSKYEMDSSFLTSKAYPKIFLELKVLNKNDEVIYTNKEVNSSDSSNLSFSESEIYSSKSIMLKVLNSSIKSVLSKLIEEMKTK